jgi:prepilin-type processing-associated H-X9-DG protein
MTEIADGTSNTIAFGESLGTGQRSKGRECRLSWMGAGAIPTGGGLPTDDQIDFANFSSRHSAVVQFGFADGSVRAIRKGIMASAAGQPQNPAWTMFQYIGGMQDGGVVDWSQLGN